MNIIIAVLVILMIVQFVAIMRSGEFCKHRKDLNCNCLTYMGDNDECPIHQRSHEENAKHG